MFLIIRKVIIIGNSYLKDGLFEIEDRLKSEKELTDNILATL